MADNLKPYDPNKSFISFKLNPDAIKEELISFVPYNRTLRHIYNNPEGDIRETAEIAVNETPVLGSLLAGEPVDAAKEAFLFGVPIKAPASFKKEINNLPKTTKFRQEDYYVRAYDPKSGNSWKVLVDMDGNGRVIPDYGYNGANFTANHNKSYKPNEVNKFIDVSTDLHKLNENDKLRINPERIDNPYDFDRLRDPVFANSIEGKLLKEGDDLTARWTGRGPRSVALEQRINNSKAANILTPKLKKGESLLQDKYGNLVVQDKKGKYWHKQIDLNSGKIVDEYTVNYTYKLNPYSDPMLSKDIKDYNNAVREYKTKYMDEDTYIKFKDPRKWMEDVYDARDAYLNSIYGPFYEDIMGIDRFY